MKSSIPKLGLILIAVIVFPTLLFSTYEINNISKNEQVVDSIYSSQLASIVFSLNQYSDDILGGWSQYIDKPQLVEKDFRDSITIQFFNWNQSVQAMFLANGKNIAYDVVNTQQWPGFKMKQGLLEEHLEIANAEIAKIQTYLKEDYRKILPVTVQLEHSSMVVFALKNNNDKFDLCGLVFNSEHFARNKLGPKIQSMAQEKFIVSIFNANNEIEIYSNDFNDDEEHRMRIKEDLWMLQNCQVGIYLVGDPIEKMVQKRTRTNIIMIVLMDIVLLLGAWFIYRNVRHEIKLAQIKSEFVSNVSHEIKTPLAVINMYSETLDMGRVKTEDKKKEYYQVINKEAKRLSGMVNKILSFSKIEDGKRQYHFIDIDLNELVENICSNYKYQFYNSDFSCELNMIDELPEINADEEALTDAITNLIDNAIKYSQDIKVIKISTGIKNNSAFVAISDSGIGIKEKDQKMIFDKFYRVTDGNLAHKVKGSGIGLNIVKHIIESHQGEIQVVSTFGKGSQFTLFFPIRS